MKKLLGMLAVGLGLTAAASATVLSIDNRNLGGAYTDISTTGTAIIGVTDDSEHNITSTIGNMALPAGLLAIGNNGVVVAGVAVPTTIGFTNNTIVADRSTPAGIPASGGTGTLVPLWDDHFPRTGFGNATIYWQETNDGRLIIQWEQEDHFAAPGTGTITFQLQVMRVTGSGENQILAQYWYPDAFYAAGATQNFAGSATIGLLNRTPGTDPNVLWSFNVMQPEDPAGSGGMHHLNIVPEPTSLMLLGLGALGLIRRR